MNDYIQSVPEFIGKSGTYLKNKIESGFIFLFVFGFLLNTRFPLPPLIYHLLIHTCWNINFIHLIKNQARFLSILSFYTKLKFLEGKKKDFLV